MKAKSNRSPKQTINKKKRSGRNPIYDVLIVGGGPAGSVLAWVLANHSAKVLLLDQARFPREKVCGDFIGPRSLRILDKMECLDSLVDASPLPITHVSIYLQSKCAYRNKIPFYSQGRDLPPHGYIIPRKDLDYCMLKGAIKAGTVVYEESVVKSIASNRTHVEVKVQSGARQSTYHTRLVVGADGVNSTVAKNFGLLKYDPRYIAISQRAYAEGLIEVPGEAAFFFDRDLFPGYAWIFPMAGGKANLGVGILAEACDRYNISVPQLFNDFVIKIRDVHTCAADLRISSQPIGGIVKTYGGAGRNYFNGGILIGDAASFADPMTGEGITQAMESALIGSSVITSSLELGRFDAEFLSSYERAFRRYFDPVMDPLDLCAALMRNRCFSDSWLKAVARGCELAHYDTNFAKIAGATFGGIKVDPFRISAQLLIKIIEELGIASGRALTGLFTGDTRQVSKVFNDIVGWQTNWWQSMMSDPQWHTSWASDVTQKWLKLLATLPPIVENPSEVDLLEFNWRKP